MKVMMNQCKVWLACFALTRGQWLSPSSLGLKF